MEGEDVGVESFIVEDEVAIQGWRQLGKKWNSDYLLPTLHPLILQLDQTHPNPTKPEQKRYLYISSLN